MLSDDVQKYDSCDHAEKPIASQLRVRHRNHVQHETLEGPGIKKWNQSFKHQIQGKRSR